jgi:uncharacterized NAD(P)/FAD-binding protein YdhS
VLLVGAGLTMVDAVIVLLDAGHRGPIHALSRRGLLPRPHLEKPAPPVKLQGEPPGDLISLTRFVRQEITRATDAGQSWHQVIDALRPFTHGLWRGMEPGEQRRFLRHMRAWWDVHRHRMAPEIAARIDAARTSGQLHVHAGLIAGVAISENHANVTFRPRGTSEETSLRVGRVVNCTGPAPDVTRSTDPLLRTLLESGMARPDPLHLGLDVTTDGAVLDAAGVASDRLFAVGPLTKGAWWEITSVPDIRNQCQSMARALGGVLSEQVDVGRFAVIPGVGLEKELGAAKAG